MFIVKFLPRLVQGLFAPIVMFVSAAAVAQGFPAQPMRIVVPFAPGGAADVVARVVSARMTESLGKSVVVDNRAGGGTVIGAGFVAKAPADGYTMLLTSTPHTVNPSLVAKLPFDTVKDFTPVTLTGVTPIFVVVHPSVPAQSLKELIALLKASPGKYNYGSSGNAGPQHLAGEMFKTATGTSILHVPFKGGAPAALALLSGEVQLAFTSPAGILDHVKSGRLRNLAVTTARRSQFAPDVPALSELGYPGIDFAAWMGMFVPAGTPPDAVNKIFDSARKAMSLPDTREKLATQGVDAVSSASPEQFAEFIKADIARSAAIVKSASIRLD